MFAPFLQCLVAVGRCRRQVLRRQLVIATTPAAGPLLVEPLADLVRGKPTLVLENVLLRQQRVILQRSVKRPRCRPTEHALLVLLARRLERPFSSSRLTPCCSGIASSSLASGDGCPMPQHRRIGRLLRLRRSP